MAKFKDWIPYSPCQLLALAYSISKSTELFAYRKSTGELSPYGANGRNRLCQPRKSAGRVIQGEGYARMAAEIMKSSGYMTLLTQHVVGKLNLPFPSESQAVFGQAHTRDTRRIELGCSYVEK